MKDRTADSSHHFDGHLEKPFERMTPTERLEWLCHAKQLADFGRSAVKQSDRDQHPGASRSS